MNWDKIRSDFPVAANTTYFQSAGMSPIPLPVLEKIKQAYEHLNQFGDAYFMNDLAEGERAIEMLAGLLNTQHENVCILPNNSIAMSVIAQSLKQARPGGFNIVSVTDEFPSTTVPFEYQGIQMKYAEPERGRFSVERILRNVDENTLAVVTSYVQYCTGFRQNLESLGNELKKRNVLFIVNATQGFPLFPVDVETCHIDALTCSIHKWGFAGHVGTVFYTSHAFRAQFRSPLAGWLSIAVEGGEFIHTRKNVPFSLHQSARKYYTGTYNMQSILGLKASLGYLNQIGFENIRKRLFELSDYLIQELTIYEIPIVSPIAVPEERSAIISVSLGDEKNKLLQPWLENKKIFTSYRQGMIRISVNFFNNFADIDVLVAAIREFKNQS